jgi:hypothetical protein
MLLFQMKKVFAVKYIARPMILIRDSLIIINSHVLIHVIIRNLSCHELRLLKYLLYWYFVSTVLFFLKDHNIIFYFFILAKTAIGLLILLNILHRAIITKLILLLWVRRPLILFSFLRNTSFSSFLISEIRFRASNYLGSQATADVLARWIVIGDEASNIVTFWVFIIVFLLSINDVALIEAIRTFFSTSACF